METRRDQLKKVLAGSTPEVQDDALGLFDREIDSLNAESRKITEQICRLYYGYKQTSKEKILEKLNLVKIVVLENKGVDTIHGYYQLSEEAMAKIVSDPRGQSLTFDACTTSDNLMPGLVVAKECLFLVKSTSRFFLKPDIGEVIDAINYHDWRTHNIVALCVVKGSHEELPGTDGEHFLMTVQLLEPKVEFISEAEKARAVALLHSM